jgi:hypothetical protein
MIVAKAIGKDAAALVRGLKAYSERAKDRALNAEGRRNAR